MSGTTRGITNTDENIQIIDSLTKALAYIQEETVMYKSNPNDIGCPFTPHYVYKKPLIGGELRELIESKLKEKINNL